MILRLPESSCDINDIQTLTRISQTIKHTNGSYPSIPPADDVVELGDNITCGDSGGGYTGDYMYPGHKNYILGKETGETKIQFVPMTFPDRCIVYYNNKPVIDTGYRGYNRDQQGQEIYYNTIGHISRNELIVYPLKGKKDPITNLTYPNRSIPNTLSDGYPKVLTTPLEAGHVASFNKYSASINDIDVYVYAPFDRTSWELYVHCPGE